MFCSACKLSQLIPHPIHKSFVQGHKLKSWGNQLAASLNCEKGLFISAFLFFLSPNFLPIQQQQYYIEWSTMGHI